ncbi:similar to Saccharomyces cerevisiae YJR122W IBA57 Mitochondrial matrix protein involved in the incorporation of iron-sulfur clusters into mitochondrial aconitase-type proteins [Maudiozyma barnettii]|uniref:Similar to Saccharomyces cerevisiae YJR122W IBA57 Mitochondrial matrix protein involved in the incorporation of iron-sulfur clusters into mitochondrial aconitase-type proteins n=1 Tax=Maudiozyma barnettii TaxID=61262 RepID=A0A8H2VHQ8_9SACH|nr:Iba57p [Kazachstania barnettii]CAB4255610.1 similar to Saccharomyces cerevisiae YJR122W IBA57 Mitochondrial matrix protein involved in the incorporation of iron-sulfur clusters into mitochondrial aconitase-type proteins [Kazachstania barnettii]CAD1784171.1 similar to Saccharomyces cerevisiae YJR122W IBA57 Mitochondrial matrix protein involved in the incorporation of iron-sulfur clusters into mitochondrial aconitase-type proteins [Kazachstania barnettii]
MKKMSSNYRCLLRRVIPTRLSLNVHPFTTTRRTIETASTSTKPPVINGLFKYAQLNNKSYIKINGPDSVKFINGLVSSKLQESFVKKNLTTIDASKTNGEFSDTSQQIVPVSKFDIAKGNWGLYHESGEHGPYVARFGQYTAFLDGKGKLITDSILYPVPLTLNNVHATKYPEYLIEVDKQNMAYTMMRTLEGHKILSKVKIKTLKEDELRTWDVSIKFENIPHTEENPWIDNILRPMSAMKSPEDALAFTNTVVGTLFEGFETNIKGLYIERRTDEILKKDGSAPLMFRILTDNTVDNVSTIFNSRAFPFEFTISKQDESVFRRSRLSHGLLDGTTDVKPTTVLPLELNFDYFPDVVSSNKGCYIGQELTARTFSTGILRKRIVPVKIHNLTALQVYVNKQDPDSDKYLEVGMKTNGNNETLAKDETKTQMAPNPFGSGKIVRKRNRPVGSLIAFEGDVGVVMLRTEHFNKLFPQDRLNLGKPTLFIDIGGESPETNVIIEAQEPFWLQDWFKANSPKLI